MNLSQLIATMESFEFDSRFSVLSGFSSVLSAFQIDQTVQTLIQLLRENADNQAAILARLQALIPDYQKDYMHTHDIPVCAYLYTLHQVENTAMLESVIPAIVSKKEFFWARKMAAKILSEAEQESA